MVSYCLTKSTGKEWYLMYRAGTTGHPYAEGSIGSPTSHTTYEISSELSKDQM